MSQEELKKCFDPFYSTREMGRGLGLSTALSIVTQHGGCINIQSGNTGGTSVTIYLPSLDENGVAQVGLQKPGSVQCYDLADSKGKRILVMDDKAVMRDVISKALSRMGYIIECSSCTNDAVAMFKRALENNQPFDLVILDLTIPGEKGGATTVRMLQALCPDVKAVVCSGYSNDPVMVNFEDYGFCGAIKKPFKLQELVNAVIKAVAARKP